MQAPEHAFEQPIELRWSDQDLLGHVNNARVLTLMEEGRIRVLAKDLKEVREDGDAGVVVRAMTMEFDRPVHYPQDTMLKLWIGRVGNTSYTVHHELTQNGVRCAYMRAVMVMFDAETETAVALTPAQREALEKVAVAED